ncbi:UDP-galactose phosphate transferase [Tenacibaculum holothuriorum]|uniref:UDP-galactose phosphate transferase n=1 Tax=Tenacibaculum holothuriorum TaxID=1635173 RepID=A0A1Y2PCE0_9FLAO|nr:sugar transferase [Tenacibaculum holothuriorum]OSY88146.1 UDP-galactose phosphate transferase [Tenacibaculum holothuriorum]
MFLYKLYIKRIIDLVFSIFGLLILSPFLVVLIIILTFSNKGNPFFLQKRGGINNSIFKVIKFKTMNDRRNENGELLPDQERITKVGSFVRKTSLDELPQLINVFKGDMSIIGPRPFFAEYLSLYTDYQKRRHEVRPGITGWAQVNGRNNLSWTKKFELDVWYVDNLSFLLDVKILFITLKKVLLSKDVNKEGETTTVKFNGTN